MKARITTDEQGYVTVTRDDEFTGERVSTTYFCPQNGGYVRIADGNRYPQVCEGLSSMGVTLLCSSRAALPALIRREYRRAVRS